MSIISVYKSDYDGKIFEEKSAYIKHLRKLAIQRRREKQIVKMRSTKKAVMAAMSRVKSLSELSDFIKANWSWFFLNGQMRNSYRGQKELGWHELVDVHFTGAFYTDMVSNTHSAPIGGVTNFFSKADLPQGYPGWVGHIIIEVKTPIYKYRGRPYYHSGFGSDYFANTIINLGGGGGHLKHSIGTYHYNYQIRLYASDFPEMDAARKRANVWNSISDQSVDFA